MDKTNTTSAKKTNWNETSNQILKGLGGYSSIQSGKTGFERAQGIAQIIGAIATLAA